MAGCEYICSMQFEYYEQNGVRIAALSGTDPQILSVEDAVDLLGNADYNGAKRLIVMQSQLHPDFFKLKTGLAGEILQKFSNYRMKLAIVGTFEAISSKSLRDFIYESNKQGQILFLSSMEAAIEKLSNGK